ncbi:MAG TPA: EAL domain-containing protein [Mycobacteriales bacterium]|nr:EAL domain-containing protein [Mycobacteriales bacterium]
MATTSAGSDCDLASELARGIADHALVVHYLPEIDLKTGAVTGMEAVLRWEHPRRGLLWPADFMAVAERSGLATELGWLLLEAAAVELAGWRHVPNASAAPRQMRVAVSAALLLEADVVERLAALVAAHELAPGSLGLEIGEDTLAMGSRHTPALLGDLRRIGLALTIADVRAWYGGIATMGDLPVEAVKLDRAFVRGAGADLAEDGIVSAVIALAHAHGLRVVADCVESWSEGARLCELGCDRALGYLFSGPQDSGDARLMLAHGGGWCAPEQRRPAETAENTAA